MIDSWISNLIQILFIFLKTMAYGVIGPAISAIDSLVTASGLNSYIYLFNDLLSDYISPAVGFFFQFMGPLTVDIICLEIIVTIGFYAIMMITTFILKLLSLIKKLPLA